MNACILIETRRVPVGGSLQRHLKFLPGWEPIVICSELNADMVEGKKIVIPKILPANYFYEFSQMMTRPELWKNFLGYDRVLICHQDSGLLKFGIDDFMEWDWIGAPWTFQTYGSNGGLSLRNPGAMYDICKFANWTGANEDIFFSEAMHYSKTYKPAPREECYKFSVEADFRLGTLGYHAIEKWLTNDEQNQILTQYEK